MIKVGNTYRLFRVKQYMSKKGNPYVRASLSDSVRQQDGTYKDLGWYQVTIFNNVDEIINAKMAQNEKKYPVEKIKGIAKKYNEI